MLRYIHYKAFGSKGQFKLKTIFYKIRTSPIYKNGELIYNLPTLKDRQNYCNQEISTLYEEILRISHPHEYYVDLSDRLRELKNELINMHRNNIEGD